MKPFTYSRAATVAEAVKTLGEAPDSRLIGGGTNLLDLMKMGVEGPSHLVDIHRVELTQIAEQGGGLRIGALATNTAVAGHQLVR